MSGFKVGDKVLFGRSHGEKTVGTVIKINPTKLKVRQDEPRGIHPVGMEWGVPPSLCTHLGGPEPTKRSETEILKDIANVYGSLSPENLSCDGELSLTAVTRRRASLKARLQTLFTELGWKASEDCVRSYGF